MIPTYGMKKVRIKKIHSNYSVVIADTERFGKDEIMFEGSSDIACLRWCVKNNVDHTKIRWI